LLADYYAQRAQSTKQMISDLIYPVFLLHLLVIVMTIVFWNWLPGATWGPAIVLGIIYVGVALLVYAAQSKHGESWRAAVESIVRPVPILGTGRHFLALGRLSAALEALLSAGVTVIEAWELAAAASGSPAIRRSVREWRPSLESGRTPAELLQQTRRFPDLFSNQYAAGELSGRLDQTMRRLHQYYNDEGTRKLRAVARWVPILISITIMVVIGVFVVMFWINYYGRVFSTF
jgi:type II secretory pathway component PulF